MRNEVVETGKTVEEAISAACSKLGCERDACEWEIIDLPKKGFLGLKNIPAKVKVFVETPDPPKEAKKPPAERPQEPRPQREKEKRPAREQQPPRQEAAREPAKRQPREDVNYNLTPPSDEVKAKAAAATGYLVAVLRQMELEVKVEELWDESGVCLAVQGEGLGAIIGRRGETLDALQYLSGLVANRIEGDYLRVTVDCGDYRLKRRGTLEALAHKVAGQVLKTNVSKTLEPMNPFERRIIHATVSTIEGVSSTSVGEEPNRRVVITSPTAKPPRRGSSAGRGRSEDDRGGRDRRDGERRDGDRDRDRRGHGGRDRDRDRRGGGRRDGRDGRRDRPAPYQPAGEPENPPTEAENAPLYGKIDLE